jgi:hypothetical protein
MRSSDQRASRPDIEVLREERRKLLNDAQAAHFDLLGKDPDAAARTQTSHTARSRNGKIEAGAKRPRQYP